MTITDFRQPEEHPYNMLEGYMDASSKEALLRWMLQCCIKEGSLDTVHDTEHHHPTMVADGLLEEVGDKAYRLTKKAIDLLYAVYAA